MVALQGNGEELLDLLSRQTEGLGLYLDLRGIELGEYVDLGVAQLSEAAHQNQQRHHDQHPPVLDAGSDQTVQRDLPHLGPQLPRRAW